MVAIRAGLCTFRESIVLVDCSPVYLTELRLKFLPFLAVVSTQTRTCLVHLFSGQLYDLRLPRICSLSIWGTQSDCFYTSRAIDHT